MTLISVTKKDIENGFQHSAMKDPIALAASRALRHPVSVSPTQMFLESRGVDMPPTAIEFSRNYDEGAYVEPFQFWMPLEPINRPRVFMSTLEEVEA